MASCVSLALEGLMHAYICMNDYRQPCYTSSGFQGIMHGGICMHHVEHPGRKGKEGRPRADLQGGETETLVRLAGL